MKAAAQARALDKVAKAATNKVDVEASKELRTSSQTMLDQMREMKARVRPFFPAHRRAHGSR